MNNLKNICILPPVKEKKAFYKTKLSIFVLEISLILFLLVVWLSSDSVQSGNNLLVLFLYSFPSHFLIAVVPHEPVFIYFSKFYGPITTTLVSIAGILLTEILNYSACKFVVDLKKFNKIGQSGFINKIVDIYNKAPFLALLVAGFTPVPFYPFRFLVVLAHYPLVKYILAVFLSRTPRFYILAVLGHAIKIPDYLLLILFILFAVIANVPIVKEIIQKRRSKSNSKKSMK